MVPGEGYLCSGDLNRFRAHDVREILEREKDELSSLEENISAKHERS